MAGKTISLAFKIEDDGKGLKKLVADADSFSTIIKSAVVEAQKMQPSKIFDTAAWSTTFSNAGNAAQQLSAQMHNLLGESLSFDKAMKAANTMAGKDSAGFKQLKGEVADLAKEIPIARDQLANGLYQTISNGVPEDNWIEYLNTSARSAIGGMADINKVVGVTSTVIKNYGLEWRAAQDIQDKIQLTAKNGVTSFEQLAQALPRVTGNAATLGVTIDELLGTFATLTGVSGNTAEVSTQLAAIFTALVKPSSEAAEMAAKMGIQFDAAAIKAAGGFQKFLQQLDVSVKAYAAANGVLGQEVYSKLFGSAESLRALIPLQGELAEKFTANVAAMVDSAGTMDAAYNDMASTGEATAQKLENQWSGLIDVIAGFASASQPYVDFIAGLLSTALSVNILTKSFRGLTIAKGSTVAAGRKFIAATKAVGISARTASNGVRALKIGIRGLMVASGVGIAIMALSELLAYLSSSADDAADSMDELEKAEAQAKEAQEVFTQASADAQQAIDIERQRLKLLIDTKQDGIAVMAELNAKYGESLGCQKNMVDMYDMLGKKSQQYAKLVGYEAKQRLYSSRVQQALMRKGHLEDDFEDWKKDNKDKIKYRWKSDPVLGRTYEPLDLKHQPEEYQDYVKKIEDEQKIIDSNNKELDKVNKRIEAVKKELNPNSGGKSETPASKDGKSSKMTITQMEDEMSKLETSIKNSNDDALRSQWAKRYRELEKQKKAEESKYNIGKGASSSNKKVLKSDPKTKKDYQNNIGIYKEKLTDENTAEQAMMREKIASWESAIDKIDLLIKEAARPAELDSEDAFERELEYLRASKKLASEESRANIDAEIKKVEQARKAFELAGHVEVPIEQIRTYSQLSDELAYYGELMQIVDKDEQAAVQEKINRLNKLQEEWDELLAKLAEPGEIGTLDTIGKLTRALEYYRTLQQTQSAEEVANTEKTIQALERKLKVQNRGIDIQRQMRDVQDIEKLEGKDFKIKVRSIGFDELEDKIKEIDDQLNDMKDPPTEEQKKELLDLRDTYKEWQKTCVLSFDTFKDGWGHVQNMAGGMQSMAEAVKGNGNAWERINGLVSGFIQLYDGMSEVINIIQTLSALSKISSENKKDESQATIMSTAATIADTAAAQTNTTVKSGEAIANATAEGAKQTWPMNLVAIAAGVAAVIAAIAMISSFATGGIVGGTSTSGDKVLARVNSGEMILNRSQQGRLFNMLNGGVPVAGVSLAPTKYVLPALDYGRMNSGLQPRDPLSGKVEFEIDGRKLRGVLVKTDKLTNRS